MNNIDNLIRIKEEIKRKFSLSDSEQSKLDNTFNQEGIGPFWILLALLLCVALTIAFIPYVVLAFYFGLFSFSLLAELIKYKDKKANVLKKFIRSRFERNKEEELKGKVSFLPLASLRDISATILTEVSILEVDGDNAQGFEFCSGVFLKYESARVRIKCDFRVIRDKMDRDQVSWIFQQIGETCPGIDPKNIEVIQYSSTKEFSFKKEYVDTGIINSIYSKSYSKKPNNSTTSTAQTVRRERSLKEVASVSQSPRESGKLASYSPKDDKQRNAKNKLKLLLSNILEKRKAVEEFAMEVVMRFEELNGRSPEDVSKSNHGYDIISHNGTSEPRRIEVKGLSTQGNVIITENELDAAEKLKQNFFLYILNNCAANDKKSLYILQGLKKNTLKELKKEVAEYTISYEDQERAVDTVCFL